MRMSRIRHVSGNRYFHLISSLRQMRAKISLRVDHISWSRASHFSLTGTIKMMKSKRRATVDDQKSGSRKIARDLSREKERESTRRSHHVGISGKAMRNKSWRMTNRRSTPDEIGKRWTRVSAKFSFVWGRSPTKLRRASPLMLDRGELGSSVSLVSWYPYTRAQNLVGR